MIINNISEIIEDSDIDEQINIALESLEIIKNVTVDFISIFNAWFEINKFKNSDFKKLCELQLLLDRINFLLEKSFHKFVSEKSFFEINQRNYFTNKIKSKDTILCTFNEIRILACSIYYNFSKIYYSIADSNGMISDNNIPILFNLLNWIDWINTIYDIAKFLKKLKSELGVSDIISDVSNKINKNLLQ